MPAGITAGLSATPQVSPEIPQLRRSWRPLAIAALALGVGGAGAWFYARFTRDAHRAGEDGARAELAAAAPRPDAAEHPGAAIVEPTPSTPAAPAASSSSSTPAAPKDSAAPLTPAAPNGSAAPVMPAEPPAAPADAPAPAARAPGVPAPAPPPIAAPQNATSPSAAKPSDRRPVAVRPPPPPPAAGKVSGPPGFITIDSSPVYATIYIDGKSYGETPLVRLELPPGRHVVHAVAPSGAARDVRISDRARQGRPRSAHRVVAG